MKYIKINIRDLFDGMIEVIWHHRNLDNLQRNQWEWLRGQRQLCALKREEIDYKMLSIKCNVHNGLTQKTNENIHEPTVHARK